jgi:hypothetical protein
VSVFPRWSVRIRLEWTSKAASDSYLAFKQFTGERFEREIEIWDVVFYTVAVCAWVLLSYGRGA